MQNDILNVKKDITKLNQKSLDQLDNSKMNLFNDYINLNAKINSNDFDIKTISTHKNSADSLSSINSNQDAPLSTRLQTIFPKQNFTNIYLEESKIRRDIFGREIKRGGKHKISFADDLDIIKSLMPDKISENSIRKNRRINSPAKNLKSSLATIKEIKRSYSLKYDRSSMLKNIYNISKKKTKSERKLKDSIVHIIEVENLKSENKLNTFSIKNRTNLAEEENVSCSCYCSIW